MAETRKNKRTWFDEGYGRPQGAAEQRVEYISITYRSMGSDKLIWGSFLSSDQAKVPPFGVVRGMSSLWGRREDSGREACLDTRSG